MVLPKFPDKFQRNVPFTKLNKHIYRKIKVILKNVMEKNDKIHGEKS